MAPNARAVLDAVARRLDDDPEHVLPTLRLLADPNALPDGDAADTITLARRVNADRLAAHRAEFRRHALSTSDVSRMLGVTRQALSSRVAHGSLLALEIGGTRYYPDWQFGPDGVRRGVGQIVAAIESDHRGVLAADRAMRTPLPEEDGRTPAELLADGQFDLALHYVSIAGGGF